MFTGIIEEIGTVKKIKTGSKSAVITIQAKKVMEDLHLGDSIAANGVCLTVTKFDNNCYDVDVMHETLRMTNLGDLKSGSRVNLERAMAANGRFGGHMVAGHIDGTGRIISMEKDDNAIWFHISTDGKLLKYIINKGSVAVDGVSLTVAKVDDNGFSFSMIPHTGEHTILLDHKPGDTVNIETDMIGKYVEKMMGFKGEISEEKTGITLEFLTENGF